MIRYQKFLGVYGRKNPIYAVLMWESVMRVLQSGRTKDPVKIAAARALHHATKLYVLLHAF